MKGIKLSKTSWLILSAGVFLVVLAGLGLTRSQQMKEQTKLDDELSLSTKRLATLQTAQLSQQLEDLTVKVQEGESQLKEAQARLHQTVISVDVTDEFFKIAEYCSVNVTMLSTTTISHVKYDDIDFSAISLSATIAGYEDNIISLINALNNSYVTGKVQTAQVTYPTASGKDDSDSTAGSTASVSMIIYSYEGQ
jgi:predicted signal transduction protein with EAL and GGDEF domain